jgi:hypothetical protein
MPWSNAAAAAQPGDGTAEWAADRRSLGLRLARRKIRLPVRPQGRHPAGAPQAHGVHIPQQDEDQRGEAMDEPFRQLCGRVQTGPFNIGGKGSGRSAELFVPY